MKVVRTYPGVGGAVWLDLVREEPGKYAVYPIGFYEPLASGFITLGDAEIFVNDLQDQQRAQLKTHEAMMQKLLEIPAP